MCTATQLFYLVVQRVQRVEAMRDSRERRSRSPIIALALFVGYRVHKQARHPRDAMAVWYIAKMTPDQRMQTPAGTSPGETRS